MDDLQEDGLTTSQTGADVHYQRLFNWRLTDRSGEESLASTATGAMSSEERREERCTNIIRGNLRQCEIRIIRSKFE